MLKSGRPKSVKCQNPKAAQFSFHLNWAYPDTLYALACPVGHIVEFEFQTLSEIWTSTNWMLPIMPKSKLVWVFGIPLY